MKRLFQQLATINYFPVGGALLLTLSGCQPATDKLTPSQQAISTYIKQQLVDSTSYQPVRWGTERKWRQQDWDSLEAITVQQQIDILNGLSRTYLIQLDAATKNGMPADTLRIQQNKYLSAVQKSLALKRRYQTLQASTDTLYRGTSLAHTFRYRNEARTVGIDSAQFTVRENGNVIRSKGKVAFFDDAF